MLLSLSQMFWGSFFLFVIMVNDVIEHSGYQGGCQGPDVVGLLLEFKLWWLDQHLIQYVWPLVLAYISI